MKKIGIMIALTTAVLTLLSPFAQAVEIRFGESAETVVVDISRMSAFEVESLKSDPSTANWVELGDRMLVTLVPEADTAAAGGAGVVSHFMPEPDLSQPMLALIRGADSPFEAFRDRVRVLEEGPGYRIFQAPAPVLDILMARSDNHFMVEPIDRNMSLRVDTGRILDRNPGSATGPDKSLKPDKARIGSIIKALQEFKTRHSLTEKYVESAKWAEARFKAMGYTARLEEYSDYNTRQYNVVAEKNFSAAKGFFIVCGHLDSTSPQSKTLAPGADDNASGSAGVIEIATLLASNPTVGRVRFVLFAGEELGLKGSGAYVRQLKADNELDKVLGVANMDMIGFDRQPPLSTLLETRQAHEKFVARFVREAEGLGMKPSVSYRPWGSDHVPFLNQGIPCILMIEDEYEDNPNYHQTTDLLKDVNLDLAAGIVESIVRVITALASEPVK